MKSGRTADEKADIQDSVYDGDQSVIRVLEGHYRTCQDLDLKDEETSEEMADAVFRCVTKLKSKQQ